MTPHREPDQGDQELATACGMLSLPFHYVFWLCVFDWLPDRRPISWTTFLVVAGMGVMAFGLTYAGYALSTSKLSVREARLPNSILFLVAAVLIVNAVFQFNRGKVWFGIESLGVSLGAFLLARKRSAEK